MPLDTNLQPELLVWIIFLLNKAWMAMPLVSADCGGKTVEMLHLTVAWVSNDKSFSEAPFAVNWLQVRDMSLAFSYLEAS